MSRILVFRERRVNLIYPVEDAAGKVPGLREPNRSKKIDRFRAPAAHFAVHNHLSLRVELRIPPRYFAERHQGRALDTVDLVLVGLANVENRDRLAAVEPLFELDGADFSRSIQDGRLRCGRMNAAE